MSDQEILALSAGPALDALIASKVMNQGWQGGAPIPNYDGRWPWPPPYSTDIAAAWLVAWHFWTVRQKDVRVTLSRGEIYAEIGNVLAGEAFEADGSTVPEAICRAALLAAEGQA